MSTLPPYKLSFEERQKIIDAAIQGSSSSQRGRFALDHGGQIINNIV